MKGYIYCLSNASFKINVYKIGTTKNIEKRLNQLYNTSTPLPFKIEIIKYVNDAYEVETCLHKLLDKYRINDSREYFELELEKIQNMFDLLEETDKDEPEPEPEDKIKICKRIYNCSLCNRKFKQISHLKDHLNRKYKCNDTIILTKP